MIAAINLFYPVFLIETEKTQQPGGPVAAYESVIPVKPER